VIERINILGYFFVIIFPFHIPLFER